ncbi:MAG: multiheme c-type cytochrome [Planctomycetota bacterium]|nr:multiheme c-type cytochrome [Planctomycetota bacterium]
MSQPASRLTPAVGEVPRLSPNMYWIQHAHTTTDVRGFASPAPARAAPGVAVLGLLLALFAAASPALAAGLFPEASFHRGDANQDASLDLSDPICILNYLFLGEGACATPSCLDALDADDTEEVNVTDAVYLFLYLFLGGQEVPPPFNSCGPDLPRGEPQLLGCESYSGCADVELAQFSAPETCATCHPRQYREWSGSMHSYAARSPLFNALEVAGNRLLANELRPQGEFPLFCIKCHNAIGTALGEIPPPAADGSIRPAVEHASPLTGRGIQCDVCHYVRESHPQVTVFQEEAAGDRPGVANAAFRLEPGVTRFGPLEDPVPSSAHLSAPGKDGIFRKGEFCGMCHDVRLPGVNHDNREPFLRLENLFTEWEKSPYNDPADPGNVFGRTVSCQDCHMSLFPFAAPGFYPSGRVAESSGEGGPVPPVRSRVSTHFFTAVDKALIPFPNQFGDQLDDHGNPASQDARRRRYLELAATVGLAETVKGIEVREEGATLPVRVTVSNFLTGHNLPAGFSQERQIWVELTVEDAGGTVLYRSGHLEDRPHPETGEMAPDGSLADEDLLDKSVRIDPLTGEATVVPGPDRNLRPAENRGLISFQNEFVRRDDGGTPDDPSDDTEEEVFNPFLANHINNDVALAPQERRTSTYDVTVPSGTPGPISIRVRLLHRQFPPYFVRYLASILPDRVSEEIVDRLDIVEMASASLDVAVNGSAIPEVRCVDYETEIQPIWNRRCMPCHDSQSPMMNLDLSAGVSYENLVNAASLEAFPDRRVEPFDAGTGDGGSFLADKILSHTPRRGRRMPAGGALPLSTREMEQISRWIEEGALRQVDAACAGP